MTLKKIPSPHHTHSKHILQKNWSKTDICGLSSGQTNLHPPIWGHGRQLDDRHRNPNISIREIIWLGNQLNQHSVSNGKFSMGWWVEIFMKMFFRFSFSVNHLFMKDSIIHWNWRADGRDIDIRRQKAFCRQVILRQISFHDIFAVILNSLLKYFVEYLCGKSNMIYRISEKNKSFPQIYIRS